MADPVRDETELEAAGAMLTPGKVVVQVAGFLVGISLLVWIVRGAIAEGDWGRLADADPLLLLVLVGATAASNLLNGAVFWYTIRPVKRIAFWDLQRINVAANMLNYAPIRLGAIARIIHHLRVDRLTIVELGAWFTFVGLVLCLAVASCVVATLIHATFDFVWIALVLVQLAIACGAVRALAAQPLVRRRARGLDRIVLDPASLWIGAALRLADVGAYALRMGIAALILGIELPVTSVVALAVVALLAGLIPFGRLGVREFCVAAVATRLDMNAANVDQSMEQLAIIESAGEAAFLIPVGGILLFWVRRRWTEARNGARS